MQRNSLTYRLRFGADACLSRLRDLTPFYLIAFCIVSSLKAFGADVDYREVKDVEHMVVVQAALNDAMAFFETHQ